MNLYDAFAQRWASDHRVDRVTWELLEYCVKRYDVKTCVEFGCGLSTLLLDFMGVHVTAFEDRSEFANPLCDVLQHSSIVLYNDIFKLKIGSGYDMAFIDGPQGAASRDPAYWHIAKARIPLVVCHDIWRCSERLHLLRFFRDWHAIGNVKSNKGGMYSIAVMLGDKNGTINGTKRPG